MSPTTPSRYQLIGHPLTDLITPFVHEHLFRLSGKCSIYDLYEITTQDFTKKIPSLMQNDGLCVAVPYKKEIIKYLDRLDEKAALSGCVNCVGTHSNLDSQKKIGHNTECFGFTQSLKTMGVSLRNKKVLLIGVGEYAKVVAIETVLSASALTIATTKNLLECAELLQEGLMDINACANINVVDVALISGGYDLIVNASAVGMYPHIGECPISEDVIKKADFVYDFICNPPKTILLSHAEKYGKPCANGIGMLVWQAVGAHEFWYNAKFKEEDIKSLIAKTEQVVVNGFSETESNRASKLR